MVVTRREPEFELQVDQRGMQRERVVTDERVEISEVEKEISVLRQRDCNSYQH